MVATVLIAVVTGLLGWLTGMWTKTRSSHWCPVDGSRLRCLDCARAGLHTLIDQDRPHRLPYAEGSPCEDH
jgi:hypothetical protein